MHGRPSITVNLTEAETHRRQIVQITDHKASGTYLGNHKSIHWFIVAASFKVPAAQLSLGLCYYNGIGIAGNDRQAFNLFLSAASPSEIGSDGLPAAQNMVGNLYIEGAGVERDPSKAIKWYIKAAEMKEASAIFNIGTLFERGLGLEQDYSEAYSWYLRAAIYGSTIAMNVLGVFNENGFGVDVSAEEAAKWYRKGALKGHAHAQYNLARCYYDGCGVEKNWEQALKYFEAAARQHHDRGLLTTAICYEHGIGTMKDMDKAVEYYLLAANQSGPGKFGGEYAQNRLKPIIATEMLVPGRLLFGPKRPNGMTRADSKFFEDPSFQKDDLQDDAPAATTSRQPRGSTQYSSSIIESIPQELMMIIMYMMNDGNILSRNEIENIIRLSHMEVGKSSFADRNAFMKFVQSGSLAHGFLHSSVEETTKKVCECMSLDNSDGVCRQLSHLLDLY